MVASLYCWEKRIFPLAYVEVETDDEGKIQSIECRDDEWALNYEMPPSRSCRFGSPDYRGSIPRTAAAPRSKLKWMGRAGNSTRQANLPRLDLRDWSSDKTRRDPFRMGRFHHSPPTSPAGRTLEVFLPLNRDESASVQQSKGRSYTSYGRILFKASATTLFGRIHVDKQNSFISEKCDFAGLWELARITKLPIQYSARTTTGTGISYMQMELAHRDGVLIPNRKRSPKIPKHPDELLCADRGGSCSCRSSASPRTLRNSTSSVSFRALWRRFNISPRLSIARAVPMLRAFPNSAIAFAKKGGASPAVLSNA